MKMVQKQLLRPVSCCLRNIEKKVKSKIFNYFFTIFTGVTINTRALPMPPKDSPVSFVAEHTFIFFIIDKTEKAIIFNGQIAHPVAG